LVQIDTSRDAAVAPVEIASAAPSVPGVLRTAQFSGADAAETGPAVRSKYGSSEPKPTWLSREALFRRLRMPVREPEPADADADADADELLPPPLAIEDAVEVLARLFRARGLELPPVAIDETSVE
jgi:hypothetical protein